MSLIEGVGDEVVQFVVVVLVVVVASLAWWSTNARPDRYRTVLVMRSRPHHPVTVSILTRSNITNTQVNTTPPSTLEPIAANNTSSDNENSRDNRVIPLQEMDSIVDADMAMLNNNRLHFYRRIDSPPNNQIISETQSEETDNMEEQEPASNAQIREMDSIVSAMEADVTTGCDFFTRSSESHSNSKPKSAISSQKEESSTDREIADVETENAVGTSSDVIDSAGDERKILIKLKYLNDTLKEVEGSLDELLKDFKQRHFSAELCADRRVRLIFRGRVLGDEAATLRACGLHHQAVVHCLVHPSHSPRSPRVASQQQQNLSETSTNATHELVTETAAVPERAWDLENILMTLVSVALTVVWFFRCEYSNMFTASASVALFGLTVFYSVAIFGLYLSDTFHFDRRPAQPLPNN
ncbi:transmembrane and ubiquitin-like domain-containing protein 1 [Vanessa atalanta]|uniref:transmembrane and ubiquitin-like domain-containing protein 1 n=1 Tax=Vanessa atalanta TaxID=42275 RepID=UPI001FCE1D08|nr:transmembrane and ubiquitin-like domain-containing protein 1 [Vanessa atalanta]